jgi:3-oxoacyl-[acyl-carrier protein] reductase
MGLTNLSRSIDGLIAVVTGAGSGMGAATAKLFADQGAQVAAIDINAEAVQQVVDEISDAGKVAQPWALDLADPQAIDTGYRKCCQTFWRYRSVDQ